MTAVAWPKVAIPTSARTEWERLIAALVGREPPCSDDAELWFSYRPDETEAACLGCLTCPAFTECDAYADAAHEQLGVWAGRDRTPPRATTEPNHESEVAS